MVETPGHGKKGFSVMDDYQPGKQACKKVVTFQINRTQSGAGVYQANEIIIGAGMRRWFAGLGFPCQHVTTIW